MHTYNNIEWRQKFSVLVPCRIAQHTILKERRALLQEETSRPFGSKSSWVMEETETQRAWGSWPRSHLWSHRILCFLLTFYNQMMTKNLVEKIYNMTNLIVNFYGFHLLPSPLPYPRPVLFMLLFSFPNQVYWILPWKLSYIDSFYSPSHILLDDLFNILLRMSIRKKMYYGDKHTRLEVRALWTYFGESTSSPEL